MARDQQELARRDLPEAQELLALSRLRIQQAPPNLRRARSHRRCPLPTHDLRNGRLNQTAYSLYLFIRDIADGDLVGWIDQRLQAANSPAGPDRLARMREALIEPLREVYGVSDKVLTMALSSILLGAPKRMRLWHEVGASMIAVDTLVHNFLHRTGILHRFGADHAYGAACYRPGGCADIIETVAERIDASAFNPAVPAGVSRGSCSTRSGGTAPRAASTSATATASMTESLAQMPTVRFTVFVTELRRIMTVKVRLWKVTISNIMFDYDAQSI